MSFIIGETRLAVCDKFVDLVQDPLNPLNRSRNHCIRPWDCPAVHRTSHLPCSDAAPRGFPHNRQHTFSALVHLSILAYSLFIRYNAVA